MFKISKRNYSKIIQREWPSKIIRKTFLDYFVNEKSHQFIRSSPVVPFCDPTVAFVNAGMNQFKNIFIGKQTPQHKKVANTQKCIRVGGKHNDFNVVGSDGFHHTFFEMFGNWSFGDYFKKEACEMAWNLLTKVYKIPPFRLYITYFKGDKALNLSEDIETREIWKSLGVPENRLVAFGMNENFWEMGATGPCGPCTEIHFDHIGYDNRAKFINKNLHDLTELWNIVFIEYIRNLDGTISLLPQKHVDTGMGFERLTSILQGTISNYDTDNFTYLIKAIAKNCSHIPEYKNRYGESDWNNLDSSYRTVADHVRMITVCLADGVIPEQNQKLRRIIRKVFHLSETIFKKEHGLLKELTNYVIDHLGPHYPELERNAHNIHQIIDFEENVFKTFRLTAFSEWSNMIIENPKLNALDIFETPSLASAYRDIKNMNPESINGKIAFRLYDAFGLDKNEIKKLSEALNLKFDEPGLEEELHEAKLRSKQQHFINTNILSDQLHKLNIPKTNYSKRYDYKKIDNKYTFDNLNVKILKIVKNLEIVPEIQPDIYCSLILDQTNFYTEAGGQISDQGTIMLGDNIFEITEAQNCDNYIFHKGFFHSNSINTIKEGDKGLLFIDSEFRLKNMRNHTAVHLLNAILKQLKGATSQKSSKVTDNYLNLDLAIFGEKLSTKDIDLIENKINKIIQKNVPVNIREIDSQELLGLDNVTFIPGEIYPDNSIRLTEILDDDLISREPCCGTHVDNTRDLQEFRLIKLKSLGRSTASIYAVTGDRAKIANSNGLEILDQIENFQKTIKDNIDKPDVLNVTIKELKKRLNFKIEDSSILPLLIKLRCEEILNKVIKEIKNSKRGHLHQFVNIEMQNAIESNISKTKNNQKYLIHYLRSSMILETVSLQQAVKICPDIPVLIISYSDNIVKARCSVPKRLANKHFNAEKWLQESVAKIFNSTLTPPKDFDNMFVSNMKPTKVNLNDWDSLLNNCLVSAKNFVENNL